MPFAPEFGVQPGGVGHVVAVGTARAGLEDRRGVQVCDAQGFEVRDQGDGVVVLTDILGGTPSNLAFQLCDHRKVEVIAGVNLPLLVKLSPNVTSIAEMARVAEGEGADGLSLINTLQALDVDVATRRPVLRNVLGGLSGPAILPVALRMVFQASRAVAIPICGIGGIATAEDAVKFLLCGATAVQVGTASYLNPMAAGEVAAGIEAWCAAQGVAAVGDLVGALELP